jgi:histidyl-tRNA synthetase
LTIKTIKGTRDILPPETALWNRVEFIAREILELYQFSEIRTPIFEATELFARGVGEDTDIVSKEMYTFEDRDDKLLTLRPEGTAPVVRSVIEHQLIQDSGILKLYYLGPMFRRERPQKGRYRQFHQIGAEVLGSDNPAIEAEVLEMLQLYLEKIGIHNHSVLINSIGCPKCRPRFLVRLREELLAKKDRLCGDCQRRATANPLRVLDCKVESCQPVIESLPVITDFLDQGCQQHFDQFQHYLWQRGIAYTRVPRLVRGLDYYTRTTFEITSDALGAQNTLIGGGRYDGLSEVLGGPPIPGFGFALGLERILLLVQKAGSLTDAPGPQLFLAPLGEEAFAQATLLAKDLRRRGVRCFLDLEQRSLKSAMRLANRLNAEFVLMLGESELRSGRYQLKKMSSGEQRQVGLEEVFASVSEQYGGKPL